MTPPPPGRGDVVRSAYVYLLRSLRDGMFYTGAFPYMLWLFKRRMKNCAAATMVAREVVG